MKIHEYQGKELFTDVLPVMEKTREEVRKGISDKEIETLKSKISGQDEAITLISKAVRRARSGLKNPKRPIGCFLFLGPTGVGKTHTVQKLSEFLFGSEEYTPSTLYFAIINTWESISIARSAEAVSVVIYGFPIPAANITTRPFSK